MNNNDEQNSARGLARSQGNEEQRNSARGLARSQGNEEQNSARGLARSQGSQSQGSQSQGEMRFIEGRGWHSRGYLPHFDRRYLIQSITLHLGDSLPQEKLKRLEEELKELDESLRDRERRKKIEAWLDAGYGCCVLRDPRAAAIMEGALFHFDGVHYRLIAWVIMPNHVHVVVEVIGTRSLGAIVHSWKNFTAKEICETMGASSLGARQSSGALPFAEGERSLTANDEHSARGLARSQVNDELQDARGLARSQGNDELQDARGLARSQANDELQNSARGLARSQGNDPLQGLTRKGFWHLDFHDRFIRDGDHFANVIRYIHDNPKDAGLVRRAQDWQWSSARFLNDNHGRTNEQE